MITTHLRNLLTAVICIFAGATAQAQFTKTVEQFPRTDFSTKAANFKLSEVAAQVGTDAETLAGALDSWTAEGSEDASMFFLIPTGTTEPTDNYTQGGKGGFWVNLDGAPQEWNDETNATLWWYNTIGWDADNDLFTINMGQYPDAFKVGDKATAKFVLKYNEKEATFDVTLSVVEMPELPEPTTLVEAELNIVGEAELNLEKFVSAGWATDPEQVNIADAADKFGVSGVFMADVLEKMLYTTAYNMGEVEDGGGLKMAEVTNEFTATPYPGFWFSTVTDEMGELTGELSSVDYNSGKGDKKLYINNVAYDEESGNLKFDFGQMPNAMKDNDKYFFNLYLIYGNKAYRIHVNLNILEREISGLDGMEKVGETDVEVQQYPKSSYDAEPFSLDVDAIAEALGTEVGSFSFNALSDENNIAPGYTTNSNEYGFWFNFEGFVTNHGNNSAFYINPASQYDYSTMNLGQMPNTLKADDVIKTDLLFIKDTKYFVIHLTLTILNDDDKPNPNEFINVGTKSYVIQQEQDNNYTWSPMSVALPEDYIAEKLGEGKTWKVYGLTVQNEDGSEPEMKYTDEYSCTPYPGFWLNKEGRNCTWYGRNGTEPLFGITVDGNGVGIQMIQYPGRTAVGDTYNTQVFLVDESTKNMITINVTYLIVSEVKEYEEVGSTSLVLPVSTDEYTVAIDLAPAAEALGVTVDDILNEDNYYLHGMNIDGLYISDEEGLGNNAVNGLAFNYDGGYDPNGSIFFIMEKSSAGSDIIIAANDDVEDDFSADGAFCIRVGEKQYVYNLRFVSPAIYTGISVVDNTPVNSRIFDLSGRQVEKPVRGLYIQNGKKIVVK